MSTAFGTAAPVRSTFEAEAKLETAPALTTGDTAVRTLSGARILFGAIFLFDGILKWVLLQQGTLQGVVQGSVLDAATPL